MQRPLASVVVDNYNYAGFLGEAIDSALAQTYDPREVVVVDDGSTDGSREVIARYGDRIVPVLQENRGQAGAFNAGFRASRGDVVAFLDADDVLFPRALERAVPLLDQPHTVKVHWPLVEMDEAGRRLGTRQPRRRLPEGDYRAHVLREGPAGHVFPPTSGNAWKRSFLDRVLPMPEPPFRGLADAYLLTIAPLAGSVSRLARPQGKYRIHDSNVYAGKRGLDATAQLLVIYDALCEGMSDYLVRREGIPIEPSIWKAGNREYDWMTAIVSASAELDDLLEPGSSFVLVDEDRWGNQWEEPGMVCGRRALPFLEREGGYWGRPVDDDEAVRELERMRRAGAEAIVFSWHCRWWLEHYPRFARHLRDRYPTLAESERLVVFGLSAPARRRSRVPVTAAGSA